MKELSLEEAALAWAQKKNVEASPELTDNWGSVYGVGNRQGVYTQKVFCGYPKYRFRLAPEPPAIGSAEWANSLPEGTKVKHKAWRLAADNFTEKRNGVWSKWASFSWTPDDGPKTGWELYTEPPAKKFRPYTRSEIEKHLGVGVQHKGRGYSAIIIAVFEEAVHIGMWSYTLDELLENFTWSDGSRCGVEVNA